MGASGRPDLPARSRSAGWGGVGVSSFLSPLSLCSVSEPLLADAQEGQRRGWVGAAGLGPYCGLLPALPLPSPSGAEPTPSVASLPQLWLPQGLPRRSRALVTEGRQEGLSRDQAVRRWGCCGSAPVRVGAPWGCALPPPGSGGCGDRHLRGTMATLPRSFTPAVVCRAHSPAVSPWPVPGGSGVV